MNRNLDPRLSKFEQIKNVALAFGVTSALLLTMVPAAAASGSQQRKKPNILVIFGDDIGYWNVSAYNRGMMGYRTPNIDR